jgi:HK97 family phage portal protein
MIKKVLEWLGVRKEQSGLAGPAAWFKEALGFEQTWAGVTVTPESSLRIAAVAACVRLYSESVASLPLHVYERTERGKLRADGHALYGVLHDAPNDYQTSYTWRSQAMAHVLLWGNAYSVIERDSAGRVRALWPLQPERVVIRRDGAAIYYEHYAPGREMARFEFGDVLHLKNFTLDGVQGVSVISMARQGIGEAEVMARHSASTFKNQVRPSLIMKSAEWLTPDNLMEWKDFITAQAAAYNAGKIMALPGAIDLDKVPVSNEDAQFLQSRTFSVQEIARWFRVPAHLIGDPTRLGYNSAEQEMLSFQQHTLRPVLVNLEAELNFKLFPDRTRYFAEFDANGLSRADQPSRYESYSKGLSAGFLTVNDVRRWENLPELEGGDMPFRPANMLPQGGSDDATRD